MKVIWKLSVLKLAAAAALLLASAPAQALDGDRGDASISALVQVDAAGAQRFDVEFAASGCTIDRSFAKAAHLPLVGPATGARVLARGAHIDGISLGDLRCTPGDRNVLGGDAFNGLVVRVDFATGRFTVHGGAQEGQELAGPEARLIPLADAPGGRPALPVRLNGAVARAVIDPSRPLSQVNAALRARAGAPQAGARDVLDLAGFNVRLAPRSSPAPEAQGAPPEIRLGRDALEGFALVIDTPRRRAWIDPRS